MTWFASPRSFQEEIVRDLEKNQPGLILYSSDSWTDAIDGIEKEERFSILVDYLIRTYRPWRRIGGFYLYQRVDAARRYGSTD